MNQFKELKVWKEAMNLAVEAYKLTKQLPSDERFNLTSQMNRSAVLISSNIAEGCGRNNPKEFRQFLGIAQDIQTKKIVQLQNMTNKLIKTL